MALVKNLGGLWAEHCKIRVKNPRLNEATILFDDLRAMKRLVPYAEQKCGAIFAASATGKSMTVRMYIESVVVPELVAMGEFPADMPTDQVARLQNKVLHVTLSSPASPKSLASDILFALGDPRWDKGTARTLMQRAYTLLEGCKTELVVINEIQHLSTNLSKRSDGRASRSGVAESTTVTDTLKNMLIDGLVPLVFVGLNEARHHLFNDIQIASRCIKELNFHPLDYNEPSQQRIFIEFCGRLGLKLRAHGIFEDDTNLVVDDIPACLHEVSGGRLGMVCNVVQAACEVAVRQDERHLKREHLDAAVDEWAIPHGVVDYNPFRDGVRVVALKKVA